MPKSLQAALMCMAAMATFGLIDNFMAPAAAIGGLWQFHALRGLLAVTLLIGVAMAMGLTLRPRQPRLVALRTALNGGAMLIYFGSLGFMPIAQVAAGLFTAPLWVVLLAWAFFDERPGAGRLFWVGLGFVGVLVALRPEADLTIWTILPLLSGALYGAGNLITRQWLSGEGVLTLLAAFFGALGVIGALGCLFLWGWPQTVAPGGDGFLTRGWSAVDNLFGIVIVVQALGSLVGVGLSIRAYQMADPAMVSVCENTLLVFATLWAVILWGQWPDGQTATGLALVLAAGVAIAWPRRQVAMA